MKKYRIIYAGILFFSFLLATSHVTASQLKTAPINPAVKNPVPSAAPQVATPKLQPSSKIIGKTKPVLAPDIAVSNIEVRPDCVMIWTLKNIGLGQIADAAFVPGTGIRIVGSSSIAGNLGGPSLASIDPQKILKRPGGTVMYASAHRLSREEQKIIVSLQNTHVSGDVNISNNRLVKSLKCQGSPFVKKTTTNQQFTAIQPRVQLSNPTWECDEWNHCIARAQAQLGGDETEPLDVVFYAHLKYPDGSISLNKTRFATLMPQTPHQFSSGTMSQIRDPLPDGTVLITQVRLKETGQPTTKVMAEQQLPVN